MYGVLQVFKILSIFLPEFQRNTIWPIEYRLSFFTYQKKSSFSFWYFSKYQNESKSFWVYRDETFSLQFVISVSLFVDSFFISSHKKALTLLKVSLCSPILSLFLKTYLLTFETQLQKSEVKRVDRDSMSEWERRLEKPSVPLTAKGPPGPPKIVEIEKKYSAIEG